MTHGSWNSLISCNRTAMENFLSRPLGLRSETDTLFDLCVSNAMTNMIHSGVITVDLRDHLPAVHLSTMHVH